MLQRTSLLTAAMLAAQFSLAQGATAQVSCEDASVVNEIPTTCKRERVSASGNQRPGLLWARKSAEDHWQDQVINKFGERFAEWGKAACLKQECVPATLVGMTRCTLSGFPCSERPYLSNIIELSSAEVREMQRLLNAAGADPTLAEDGKFGSKSERALIKWQRKHGVEPDGLPSRANLDRLRKGSGSSASAANTAKCYEPEFGSPERKAILDVLRPPVEKALQPQISFVIDNIRICGPWGHVRARMQRPGGQEVNYSGTTCAGDKPKQVHGLARRSGGRWRLRAYDLCPTDVAWTPWPDQYGVPVALFRK